MRRDKEYQPGSPGSVLKAPGEIRRLSTPQELFDAAAEEVLQCASRSIAARGRFAIALSGGSTPKSLFTLIAANASHSVLWSKVFFFWGDERHVPPTDAESNYRMAKESLLSKIDLPESNIFRVEAENAVAEDAAMNYEQTLQNFFGVQAGSAVLPRFDLILLGMGPDGHTASLFPGTDALKEKTRLVVANWVEKLQSSRITLTVPVLNAAREVAFLISGADKAAALHEVLETDSSPDIYPSKLIHPKDGKLVWLVDRAAASELSAA